jgi:hypothetical protein
MGKKKQSLKINLAKKKGDKAKVVLPPASIVVFCVK